MRQIDLSNFKDKKPRMFSEKYKKTKEFLTEILNNHQVEKKHYDRADVKVTLFDLYKDCCAYCEKSVEKSAHIDHYRPKDATMYYWLGAEWTNFILLCSDCNLYKSNNFAIEAKSKIAQLDYKDAQDLLNKLNNNWKGLIKSMEIDSQNLIDEKPLFPHPFFDIPINFIKFTENGKIEPNGLNESKEYKQGKYFIDTLKFSERNSLFELRNSKIDDIRKTVLAFSQISSDFDLEIQIDLLLGRILNKYIKQQEFSYLFLYCYIDFKTLFIEVQKEPFKTRLKTIYEKIITKVYIVV